MRALWSDRQHCSHSVSQKVKRIKCFSDRKENHDRMLEYVRKLGVEKLTRSGLKSLQLERKELGP